MGRTIACSMCTLLDSTAIKISWLTVDAGAREVPQAEGGADEKTPERSQKSKGRMVDIMQQSPTVAQAQRTSPGPLPYTSP